MMVQVPSRLLPDVARTMLREAANIDPHIPKGESDRRTRALDLTVARLKTMYPQHFKKEQ